MNAIAIMQPYFFPYVGYWQLMHAVDRFVIYDDVNYINRGWVNRNRLLINCAPAYMTVPLSRASQNDRICDIALQQPSLVWRNRLVKMVEITYRKAPCFVEVFPVIEELIRHESGNLSDYLAHQLQMLAAFMGIKTKLVMTSRCYGNERLSGQARILDICKRERARVYVNPQGGQSLYEPEVFRSAGIDLRFIVMRPLSYKQRCAEFVPYLSIIDLLMEVGPGNMKQHLDSFDFVGAESVSRCKLN